MKAAVLHKPYDIRVENIKVPEKLTKEVLIKVGATGVCGTDILVYKGLYPRVVYPIVPGHEFAGIITRIGKKISGFQPGNKVIGVGGRECGSCYFCKTGKSNLCQNRVGLGREVNGSLAEYVKCDAIYKIPDDVDIIEAQSIPTIASAIHAVDTGGVKIGDTVAIVGPGHAGLLLVQVARIAGASQIILTGTRQNRLDIGKDLGADYIVNVKREDPIETVRSITDGLGADVVIEAAGTQTAAKEAIEMVKTSGTIVIFGLVEKPLKNFEIFKVYHKELQIVGSRGARRENLDFERSIRLLSTGKVKIKPLITHILPLEETEKAFQIAEKRLEGAIRVVIGS